MNKILTFDKELIDYFEEIEDECTALDMDIIAGGTNKKAFW